MNNIPVVKLGLIAVSRDCFPIQTNNNITGGKSAGYKKENEDYEQHARS